MAKRGKTFEAEVTRGMRMLPGDKLVIRQDDILGERFTRQKPCDFVLFYDGRAFLIECKQTNLKSLPYANIKDHQIEAMELADRIGIPSFILINFRHGRNMTAYAVSIADYLKYRPTSRKSLSMDWCKQWGKPLDRVTGKQAYWDMTPVVRKEVL